MRKTAVYQFASRGVDLLVGEISASRAEPGRSIIPRQATQHRYSEQRQHREPRQRRKATNPRDFRRLPKLGIDLRLFKVTTMSL